MARARSAARGRRPARAVPGRRRANGARRGAAKPASRRRWLLRGLLHLALALATGLVCGALAARLGSPRAAPYAAILGTLVLYPALAVLWRRLKLPLRFRRRRR